MVGRITTAHNSIQNTILTVCHANKWKHIPGIKHVELEPFSFSSTIYTTFFRECRPIEPDFCGRIMAGFILHHCLTQILDLAFSFLIQVSNLQIRKKVIWLKYWLSLVTHVSFVCRQLNLPITEFELVSSPPDPTPRPFLFPVPGALNVGLYCNVYSPCPLWIYTCSRIVFLTPFNVDPFPGRPLNFNTGINSPLVCRPTPYEACPVSWIYIKQSSIILMDPLDTCINTK